MDDTKTAKPSDKKDVNPAIPAAQEDTSDKGQGTNPDRPEAMEESQGSENPFGALKEFDVNLKESQESKESAPIQSGPDKPKEPEVTVENSGETVETQESLATEPSTPPTQASEAGLDSSDSSEEKPEPPSNPNAKWYVVHTFAGHENKVATALKQRIEAERLENLIYDILVPTQDKIEIRGGKKETVKEKIFPGYILIKMELNDTSWLAVRTTQGVTSFIGAGNKPTPISEAEVATIVKFTSQGAQPTFKDIFMVDDTVKIADGPFAEFIGKVDSVDKEKGRVRVLVSIFGRETPVELDFLQVQKL